LVGGEVVEWLNGSVAETHVVASGEVTGEFLGAKYDEHGSRGVDGKGHAGFGEGRLAVPGAATRPPAA
jgi:hypothetical protein